MVAISGKSEQLSEKLSFGDFLQKYAEYVVFGGLILLVGIFSIFKNNFLIYFYYNFLFIFRL